jgi:hypothetical protein
LLQQSKKVGPLQGNPIGRLHPGAGEWEEGEEEVEEAPPPKHLGKVLGGAEVLLRPHLLPVLVGGGSGKGAVTGIRVSVIMTVNSNHMFNIVPSRYFWIYGDENNFLRPDTIRIGRILCTLSGVYIR